MSLARLVVTAVLVEGRPKAAVARDYGVSRRWVYELVRRFLADGEAGLEPRSRRPRTSPHRVPEASEQEIVELRKHLADQGLDAGAHTIAVHLERRHGNHYTFCLLGGCITVGACCIRRHHSWYERKGTPG